MKVKDEGTIQDGRSLDRRDLRTWHGLVPTTGPKWTQFREKHEGERI